MTLRKSFHHEVHEEHKVNLWKNFKLEVDPKVKSIVFKFPFVYLVTFVVQKVF